MQLDLLNYTLTPEELAEPPPQENPVDRHRREYWEAAAMVYLKLMNRMMQNNLLPAQVKRRELERLHRMRQEALAKTN